MDEKICPEGWEQDLHENLDAKRSFKALAGFEHFHTYTLRARLRLFQLRLDDAHQLCMSAEDRFPGFDINPENPSRFQFLLAVRLEARILKELISGTPESEANTDSAMEQMDTALPLETPRSRRFRKNALIFYHLLRGNYSDSLAAFEEQIKDVRNVQAFAVVSYIGAASACFELGLFRDSRRHYENAELCMAFSRSKLQLGLHASRLAALCGHWGWDGEMARWNRTIDAIQCPEDSRNCLRTRTKVLYEASVNTKAFALA